MEYDNIDKDVAYKTACENVKKIANAIKAIKMKYYLDFSKITEEDRKIYQELYTKMEQISQANGLNKLKVALMGDIESRYDGKKTEDTNNRDLNDPEERQQYYEELKQAYFGAMDVEVQALRTGKAEICLECQNKRNKYIEEFRKSEDGKQFEEDVITYARGILGELRYTKENLQTSNETKMNFLCNCNKMISVSDLQEGRKNITEAQKEDKGEEMVLE